ncbi:hypothetical protein Hanom_Chr14g01315781 [Helianthus anomalus]
MEPIKSNQLLNQYPPLDFTEIKSQPHKLPKITVALAVQCSCVRSHGLRPIFSTRHGCYETGTWVECSCPVILYNKTLVNKHTDGTAFFNRDLKPTFKRSSFNIWMMKKNLWELKEQALLEMLQALREAELLKFIICLKGPSLSNLDLLLRYLWLDNG